MGPASAFCPCSSSEVWPLGVTLLCTAQPPPCYDHLISHPIPRRYENDMQSTTALQGLQGFKITPNNAMAISYAKQ